MRLAAVAMLALATVAAGCGGGGESGGTRQDEKKPAPPEPPKPEAVLGHYLCYNIFPSEGFRPPAKKIEVTDQFEREVAVKIRARGVLCNPATKNGKKPPFHDAHLVCYELRSAGTPVFRVRVSNQFDPAIEAKQEYDVAIRRELCVPSGKAFGVDKPPGIPGDVDHFVCYEAALPDLKILVKVSDQFREKPEKASITRIERHCNPVDKAIDGEQRAKRKHPDAHLVCYYADLLSKDFVNVTILNQFETARISVDEDPRWLCLPSTKKVVPKPG